MSPDFLAPKASDAPTDAPSELALDRYLAGELDATTRARIDHWLAQDPAARARLEARRTFPASVAPDALYARVAAQLRAAAPKPSLGKRLAQWFGLGRPGFFTLLAVAALALFVARPWGPEDPDILRPKGGFGFLIHRQTADGSELLLSGSEAKEGDRLRFELTLQEKSFVMIIDQDPSGRLGTAWPLDGGDVAREMVAGKHELDGAVELDDALGHEWLHAVACQSPLALRDVAARERGELILPPTCRSVGIELRKVRP